MDQNIELPQAVLDADGNPVLTPLPTEAAQAPTESDEPMASYPVQPDSTLYTLLDNGEYQEQMDVIYPPGTKFYFKRADGTYYDADIEIAADVATTAPEITKEFMIETSTEFLRANGYTVMEPGQADPTGSYKTQISQLKDELAAVSKPVSAGEAKFELGVALGKLRSMVSSHMTHRAVIDEAHAVISKIESYL